MYRSAGNIITHMMNSDFIINIPFGIHWNAIVKATVHWNVFLGCCDRLVITSTDATLDHHSSVLGTHSKDDILQGKISYKNDNDKDRNLRLAIDNNFFLDQYWIVST